MRQLASIATALLFLVIASVIACGRSEPGASNGAEAPSDAAAESSTTAQQSPSGDRAVVVQLPAAAAGSVVEAAALRFELPSSFEREPPASPMRLAQAVIAGEAGPGELAVFHFGAGQGGGVEANFERWLAQVERPPGAAEPNRGSFEAGELNVQWIEAAGTMLPSGMGTGPKEPQPGSRLLGAVVEGAGGPWFFKLTGPDATVAAAREPFLAMLRGARRAE